MLGWEYEGPFDHLEAQNQSGGFPFIKDELKKRVSMELNVIRLLMVEKIILVMIML